jgi:hypothetical protein
MKTQLPILLATLFAGLPLTTDLSGQTSPSAAPTRTSIPLSKDAPNLKVSGLRDLKIENMDGGGIRLTFTSNPTQRSTGSIEVTLASPVQVSTMGFECAQGTTERLVAGGMFQTGKSLKKVVDSGDSALAPYFVDFVELAANAKREVNSLMTVALISFRVPPDSGQHVVEIKDLWVE